MTRTFVNSQALSFALITMIGLSVLGGCAAHTTNPPSSAPKPTSQDPTSPTPAPVTPSAPEPTDISFNPVTDLFYVANGTGNTVSVVDGASYKTLATLTVQAYPSAVVVNPATNTIYAVNSNAGSVSVIDGATNTIKATLAGGWGKIAVNPVINRIYLLDSRGAQNYNVTVLDGTNNSVIANLQVGGNASGIAVNTKTNIVYVTNTKTLVAIDGSTNKVVGSIPVPPPPPSNPTRGAIQATYAPAVDETTNTILFANGGGDNTVDVVSGDTFTVINTIPVGFNFRSIAVNPQTHYAYLGGEKMITMIDEITNTVTGTISATEDVSALTVNPASNLLYLAMDTEFGVVNLTSNTQVQ